MSVMYIALSSQWHRGMILYLQRSHICDYMWPYSLLHIVYFMCFRPGLISKVRSVTCSAIWTTKTTHFDPIAISGIDSSPGQTELRKLLKKRAYTRWVKLDADNSRRRWPTFPDTCFFSGGNLFLIYVFEIYVCLLRDVCF